MRNPWRVAVAYAAACGLALDADSPPVRAGGTRGRSVIEQQVRRGVGVVPTTSMGRLFDAVASLLDVRHEVTYEAQAAIELEALARAARRGLAAAVRAARRRRDRSGAGARRAAGGRGRGVRPGAARARIPRGPRRRRRAGRGARGAGRGGEAPSGSAAASFRIRCSAACAGLVCHRRTLRCSSIGWCRPTTAVSRSVRRSSRLAALQTKDGGGVRVPRNPRSGRVGP